MSTKQVLHYENTLIQINWKFHLQKKLKFYFQIKNADNFHISAQNIDFGTR